MRDACLRALFRHRGDIRLDLEGRPPILIQIPRIEDKRWAIRPLHLHLTAETMMRDQQIYGKTSLQAALSTSQTISCPAKICHSARIP